MFIWTWIAYTVFIIIYNLKKKIKNNKHASLKRKTLVMLCFSLYMKKGKKLQLNI